MKYDIEKKEIIFDEKVLNALDRFTIDFISILEKHMKYVIVSGYVSILFGRSRSSEDVDFLVPEVDFTNFVILFNDLLNQGYECANTSDSKEAYDMLNSFAIRFFVKGKPEPNIEFKMIKSELDKYSFENRIRVILNGKTLFISPLEIQIPFKLMLAAEGLEEELRVDKDIEDARYLYQLFKDKINKEEFNLFIDKLGVKKKLRLIQ